MAQCLFAGLFVVCFSLPAMAQTEYALAAPVGWGGETIKLPPGFAADMKLRGVEHIRFAPGMMQAKSSTFFCYAFAFELNTEPKLTDAVVKEEFLKYYRGLSKAVLNGKQPNLDTDKFTLTLTKPVADEKSPKSPKVATVQYNGVLQWIEPFATKKMQTLNVEIQTWNQGDRNYLFASVSPQSREAIIWQQLRKIRDDYLKSHAEGGG